MDTIAQYEMHVLLLKLELAGVDCLDKETLAEVRREVEIAKLELAMMRGEGR